MEVKESEPLGAAWMDYRGLEAQLWGGGWETPSLDHAGACDLSLRQCMTQKRLGEVMSGGDQDPGLRQLRVQALERQACNMAHLRLFLAV